MEWKSVGMMKFPTEWKVIKAMFQTTNQLYYTYYTVCSSCFAKQRKGKEDCRGAWPFHANAWLSSKFTESSWGPQSSLRHPDEKVLHLSKITEYRFGFGEDSTVTVIITSDVPFWPKFQAQDLGQDTFVILGGEGIRFPKPKRQKQV